MENLLIKLLYVDIHSSGKVGDEGIPLKTQVNTEETHHGSFLKTFVPIKPRKLTSTEQVKTAPSVEA